MYVIYRQGQIVTVNMDSLDEYRLQLKLGSEIGTLELYANKILITRSSKFIIFFR
jgi:hypothetical protein